MALTKDDIIDSIYNNCGYSKTKSFELFKSILETIKKTLESNEDILISGFGKFRVNEKHARKGRNPATGNDLTLRARRTVTFRCSPSLRTKMNGSNYKTREQYQRPHT
ncbi:MAG: integration host factor subunit alpha [Deltaproteobacteria bacterium]|nr:integration host factor subunit alpha [Deltaproteobacteria bacterium]